MFKKISKIFDKKSHMENEINSQPQVISKLINKYVSGNNINISIPNNISSITLIASGSSYNSAHIFCEYLNREGTFFSRVFYSSELCLIKNFLTDENALYVFISQSGETTDTNKALEYIKSKTTNTLVITNTKDSNLYNAATYKMLTYAGVEKAVASTKAVSAQLICLFLLGVKLFQQKNKPVENLLNSIINIPNTLKEVMTLHESLKAPSKIISKYENSVILANGILYSLAKEGALKLKETSYINTMAYPFGEFLHGHMAMLNRKSIVISIINDDNYNLALDVLKKINEKYSCQHIIITNVAKKFEINSNIINVSSNEEMGFLFATLVVMQILALNTSKRLNKDIDSPQGLSKVVK